MAHAVQDLGVMTKDKQAHRWLALSAQTHEELDKLIEAAVRKHWQQEPMYSGTDPATGWLAVWMNKPLDDSPKPL